MKIGGIDGMDSMLSQAGGIGKGNRTEAIEKQIQGVKALLERLDNKETLTKAEQDKKKELERRLAELQTRLQKAKQEERAEEGEETKEKGVNQKDGLPRQKASQQKDAANQSENTVQMEDAEKEEREAVKQMEGISWEKYI